MSSKVTTFTSLDNLVQDIRNTLTRKEKEIKYILLYAYNGIGKTRLSMAFKEAGDTLYFNAFTEDLFIWDNDLDNDSERMLRLNADSRFFSGLQGLEMENRIRPLLHRYTDFDFTIDYENWTVNFSRIVIVNAQSETIENIKVSRGEENIFIWCFFLVIAQLAIDKQEAYKWVKFIYIDDPISSLDDNNAIIVASHLAQLLKHQDNKIKAVISSHHALFFNVMCNEFRRTKKAKQYFLNKVDEADPYTLRNTSDTPFFHHVAMLKELKKAVETGRLYTYHFNILRNILEKTAVFHGFDHFSVCIKDQDKNDTDGIIHQRMINILSHGKYSLFEPKEMAKENKEIFREILTGFLEKYPFNPDLFSEEKTQVSQT